jgi:hypothetical protein
MRERFIDSESWQDLPKAPSPFVQIDATRALASHDVEDLLDLFSDGSVAEELVSLGILRNLAQRPERFSQVNWSAEHRERLVRILSVKTHRCFQGARPWNDAGGAIFRTLWRLLDPNAFATFIQAQPLARMEIQIQEEALGHLADLARESQECQGWLQERVVGGGEFGERAREALEFVGIVAPARVEHWGRKWRENREPQALEWLYDRWLSHLPVGCPLDQILEVLGPPDDGEIPDLYYISPEGVVYIEAYEATGFSGCHRA